MCMEKKKKKKVYECLSPQIIRPSLTFMGINQIYLKLTSFEQNPTLMQTADDKEDTIQRNHDTGSNFHHTKTNDTDWVVLADVNLWRAPLKGTTKRNGGSAASAIVSCVQVQLEKKQSCLPFVALTMTAHFQS